MVVGVIPARYGSERFPGKPLKYIAKKPLLQWVIEGAKTSQLIDKIIVATDHQEISNLAARCGVESIMTRSDLPSGTDRVWEATKNLDAEVLINIQGDEPLTTKKILDPLIVRIKEDPSLNMCTLARPFDSEEDMHSENTAKVILNKNAEAIYFSRFPIPYTRDKLVESANLQHIGIYAYRKQFLKDFCLSGPCNIEKKEGLEQLRALYLGAKIGVVTVNYKTRGVDTPEDVIEVENILIRRGQNES